MRLIDADRMMRQVENGGAPVVGYDVERWIREQPTVTPDKFQFVNPIDMIAALDRLAAKDYKNEQTLFRDSKGGYQRLNKILHRAPPYIDMRDIREWCMTVKIMEFRDKYDKDLVEDPDFRVFAMFAYNGNPPRTAFQRWGI